MYNNACKRIDSSLIPQLSFSFVLYTGREKEKKKEEARKEEEEENAGEGITSTSRQHFTEINRFFWRRNGNCDGKKKKFVNYADSRGANILPCPTRILYYSARANERRGLTRYGQTRRNDARVPGVGWPPNVYIRCTSAAEFRGGGEKCILFREQIIRNYCGPDESFSTVAPPPRPRQFQYISPDYKHSRGLINFALSHHP